MDRIVAAKIIWESIILMIYWPLFKHKNLFVLINNKKALEKLFLS